MTKGITGSGSTTVTTQIPKSSVKVSLKQKATLDKPIPPVDTSSLPSVSESINKFDTTTPSRETIRQQREAFMQKVENRSEIDTSKPPSVAERIKKFNNDATQRMAENSRMGLTDIGGQSIFQEQKPLSMTEIGGKSIFEENNIPTPPPMPPKPQMMMPLKIENLPMTEIGGKSIFEETPQAPSKKLSIFGKMKQKIGNAFKKGIASGMQATGRAFEVCGQKMTNIAHSMKQDIANDNLQNAKQKTGMLGKLFQGAKNIASFAWQKVKGAGETIANGAKAGFVALSQNISKALKKTKEFATQLKNSISKTDNPTEINAPSQENEPNLSNIQPNESKDTAHIKELVQKLTETTEKLQKNTELSPDKTKEIESDLNKIVEEFEKKTDDNTNINPDTFKELQSGLENMLKKLQEIKTPEQPDTTKTKETETETKTEETTQADTEKLKTDEKKETSNLLSNMTSLFNKLTQLLKPQSNKKTETPPQDTKTKTPTPKDDLMETLQDVLKQITNILKTIEKIVPQKTEQEKTKDGKS